MDLDLLDVLLDADFACLETACSRAETVVDDSSIGFAVAQADAPALSPPSSVIFVRQESPAPRQPSPLSISSDSCESGSNGATATADNTRSNARSDQKTYYLPPCRVCNGPASGFHYGAAASALGSRYYPQFSDCNEFVFVSDQRFFVRSFACVNTCEACKGFFHRSLHRHSPYKCGKDDKCLILHSNGTMCSACRYLRCLEVGMNKEAVKTGRYSHAKRTQDTLEVKRLQNDPGAPQGGSSNAVTDCLPVGNQKPSGQTMCRTDWPASSTAGLLVSAFEQSFAETLVLYREPNKIDALIRDTLLRYGATSVDFVMLGDPEEGKHLLGLNEEVSHAVPQPGSMDSNSSREDALSGMNILLLKYYVEKLEANIRSIVSFAKSIPGFMDLSMHDQIVLIKTGRAEIIYLIRHKHFDTRLSCSIEYSSDKNVVSLVPQSMMRLACLDEDFSRQCYVSAKRLQLLDLSVADIALLVAIVLASPDREQLLEPERVQVIQDRLVAALRDNIMANRCSDLSAAERFLATLLIQIPVIRTLGEQHELAAKTMRHRYPFRLPPLVQECTSA